MGLISYSPQGDYYNNFTNKGDYQFVSLDSIINSFMAVYVGESKILTKVNKSDVQFHGMRAIQELSYDVLRSHKTVEQEVPATLVMPLPIDYVNYTKIVRVDSNGVERVLYPTRKTSNPFPIRQTNDGAYSFNNGEITTELDNVTTTARPYVSDTSKNFKSQSNNDAYSDDTTDIDIDNRGRRYGLEPEHAQSNGVFFIDQATGFIHFGSSLAGETITLKYISDGLGTDEEMIVHKFCEEAVYKHIMYGLLSGRSNIPEGVIQRFKREKFAETRKAKIRLSNIKMEEFTQVLKGLGKPIK
tara:strand:+ start:6187 stop:7086 length:900 start_codon:yes stop_codon:yes gene_type:complete